MKKSMNRVKAKENGAAVYAPESPCARGHVLRTTSGGTCIECRRLTEVIRYQKNPQKTKERTAKKYQANAEKIKTKRKASYILNCDTEKAIAKIRSAEWRLKNPNHMGTKEAKARYKIENPGKVLADTVKRRSNKMQRTPAWLTKDDFWMIEQAYELAVLRTRLFGFAWHVDHIIPLQGKLVSGLHVPSNLQVIPWRDNVAKANKYLPA